jgi:hypothetical protein
MNDCGEFKQGATSCRDDAGWVCKRLIFENAAPPPEFFNPFGNVESLRGLPPGCFGAESGHCQQTWRQGPENVTLEHMFALDRSRIGFTKENHGNGQVLLDFCQAGYPVFVAHRLPQHAFPVTRAVKHFYDAAHRGIMEEPEVLLPRMPAGDRLVRLRDHVKGMNRTAILADSVTDCLAHHLHFWHLILVAIENGISHL